MNLKFWQRDFWQSMPKMEFKKNDSSARYGGQTFVKSFDGEKNLGEIGPATHYILDHARLRIRSYQAYLESDLAQTIINKYCSWIVDTGLKLDADPAVNIIENAGIKFDSEKFNNVVESRFHVWAKSKKSSFDGMRSFYEVSKEAFKNAKIGGDVLVVLTYKNGAVRVRLIDGAHIGTPLGHTARKGKKIVDGIELSSTGEHVAYWVQTKTLKYERIPARSKSTGLITAFMVYGQRYRLDSHRGFPVIATSLETIKKIERYKEAAVGSAEERQKIVYQVVHNQFSDGESPFLQGLAEASGLGDETSNQDLPRDEYGEQLANKVSATTNKQAFNLPIGSKMEALESKNELFFKEFYSTNADIICGAIGIPPNVAFSIYNDSFSASRAATKDWEHTMHVERDDFQTQFLQNVYNFWLYTEIMFGNISAPGFIDAIRSNDFMLVESYLCARFTGSMFPHIDPLKEVKAERAKLGSSADHIPLTTIESATSFLNGGNSKSNIVQFSDEVNRAKELGIVAEEREQQNESENESPETDQ